MLLFTLRSSAGPKVKDVIERDRELAATAYRRQRIEKYVQ